MGGDRVWYLNTAEGAHGPYVASELVSWITAGSISNEWYVWRDGMDAWSRIADVAEFRPTSPEHAPPLPPPPESPSPLHHDDLTVFMPPSPTTAAVPATAASAGALDQPDGGSAASARDGARAADRVKGLFKRKERPALQAASAAADEAPKKTSRLVFYFILLALFGGGAYLYYLETTDPEGFIAVLTSVGLDPDLLLKL